MPPEPPPHPRLPTLAIRNLQQARAINLRFLRRLARALLARMLPDRPCNLGIVLVDATEIARLNETFLHHSGATDVIAFNYAEPGTSHAGLHGEIFICVDEALRAARRFRTTWQAEVTRYLIHGLLHLQGFDDQRPSDRRQMRRVENAFVGDLARWLRLQRLADTSAD